MARGFKAVALVLLAVLCTGNTIASQNACLHAGSGGSSTLSDCVVVPWQYVSLAFTSDRKQFSKRWYTIIKM
jgi:hypothetical protein